MRSAFSDRLAGAYLGVAVWIKQELAGRGRHSAVMLARRARFRGESGDLVLTMPVILPVLDNYFQTL